jgi:hypothetical protein
MNIRFATAGFALILAAGPAAQPGAHQFVPERFYNTFSGAHPPALRIKPGERVVTKTVDAAGTDWNGKSVAIGRTRRPVRSPSRAPRPGDAIVVTIDKMRSTGQPVIRAACSRPTRSIPPRSCRAWTGSRGG